MKNKIIFFGFSTLNFGGGCEKNFMNLGMWLQKRDHEVKYISGSYNLNNQYCKLMRIAKHERNLSNDDLKKNFDVNNYVTFDFKDLFLNSERRKQIKKELHSADAIVSKNELFEVIILRFILRVKMEKILFGFHTPIRYGFGKSWKVKVHNLVYSSRFYFFLINKSKVRCLVLNSYDKELLNKCNVNKVTLIPNGIDTDKFCEKEKIKTEVFRVSYIGRFAEQKGIDILSNSIKILSEKTEFSKMSFHFTGSGSDDNYLIQLSQKFENCFFNGFKKEVVSEYQNSDIIIVPSRWEGFPFAVLEAQSCGIPVIATNIPGSRDIVIDEETGWLCRSEDAIDLANAILKSFKIWENEYERFLKVGSNSRRRVVEKFSEEIVNKRIEALITLHE